ncbi:MAG: hypothetical protein HUK40_18060 [Desulfobacter sp.]|nr:hypothetical protein [Desulfobacter sp.]WDP85852.1 MAG: hypothetical protein HUN05_12495 [Desulfobacter sp.]
MNKKFCILIFSLLFLILLAGQGAAAKIPAPEKGDNFKAVTLKEAEALLKDGAQMVACHSHTTDFMKGHPKGTIHITCLVPKDHKTTDMPLDKVDFDIAQLPDDKSTPIITYCALSN